VLSLLLTTGTQPSDLQRSAAVGKPNQPGSSAAMQQGPLPAAAANPALGAPAAVKPLPASAVGDPYSQTVLALAASQVLQQGQHQVVGPLGI
jgi:hypothetical protein